MPSSVPGSAFASWMGTPSHRQLMRALVAGASRQTIRDSCGYRASALIGRGFFVGCLHRAYTGSGENGCHQRLL
jgi:hypothetical protein